MEFFEGGYVYMILGMLAVFVPCILILLYLAWRAK
jgi:hypothetical protein